MHRMIGSFVICVALAVGCGKTADVAPLAGAIGKLHSSAHEIIEAFEAGTPDAAHDSLHGVGDVLSALPQLAKNAGLSSEHLATIGTAQEQLLATFGQLDETLHDNTKTVDVADLKGKIEAALGSLEKALPAGVVIPVSHEEHAHEHAEGEAHDHDHDHEEEAAAHDHDHAEGEAHDHDHEAEPAAAAS